MRAIAAGLLLCGLMGCLVCAAWQERSAGAQNAVARLPAQVHDFGVLLPEARASWAFSAVNPLPQTLYIDNLVRSCGCTTAQADPMVVAPGERFSVSTVLSTHAAGEGVLSHVDVLGHAGGRQLLWNLELRADVEDVLAFPMDEGYLRLGAFSLEEMPATATVRVLRGKFPAGFDSLRIECGEAPIEASARAAGDGWDARFVIHSTDTLGVSGYPVRFVLMDHGRAIAQGVDKQAVVEVTGPVVARPSSLLLTAGSGEQVHKSIEITAREGGEAPRIVEVSCDSKNMIAQSRLGAGKSWVDLNYTGNASAEDRGEIVVTATAGAKKYRLKIGFLRMGPGQAQ